MHAYLGLRGSQLKLIALRGRLSVHGKHCSSIHMRRGVRVLLAGSVVLHVDAVTLPDRVLALSHAALPPLVLGSVTALCPPDPGSPAPFAVRAGFEPSAVAHIWQTGDSFRLRHADMGLGGGDCTLRAGDSVAVLGTTLEVIAVPPSDVGIEATEGAPEARVAMTITTRWDTVHIATDEAQVALGGIPARIVSELAAMGVPVAWQILAREIWPHEDDAILLRQKWDAAIGRLRAQLRSARLRADLVRSDKGGHVELWLHSHDRVVDEN
jgi:hypothetical protein